jgi:hypothetical protein
MLTFSIGHDPAHNFLLKRTCCRFAQVVGITSDPKITFPYFTQRSVPARSGCARAHWFQNGDGITRLKAPSTSSRDVPSVLISVRVPIKTS